MTRFPGGFTGRINSPSLPKSKTFNGPPCSNPSRKSHSSGKTGGLLSVKFMVVAFVITIYYRKIAVVNDVASLQMAQQKRRKESAHACHEVSGRPKSVEANRCVRLKGLAKVENAIDKGVSR